MRNSFLRKWLPTLFMFAILGIFAACSEDISDEIAIDPNKEVPDPAGTIQLSMRNSDNGQTELDQIYIENENFRGHKGTHYFTSLGPVNGLGNVAHIPTSGWASSVAVIPGHGYVAYSAGDSYWGTPQRWYRIYVTDYIVSTSGGIIGAKVKYQAPFKGSDEVIDLGMKEITLNAKGDTIALPFKNKGAMLFDITTDCPQLSVAKMSTYDHSFLTNGIVITSETNYSDTPVEGTVTLTTLHGKKTTLKVIIAGAKPFIELEQEKAKVSAAQQTSDIAFTTNISADELTISGAPTWCKAELISNEKNNAAQKNAVKFIGSRAINQEEATLAASEVSNIKLRLTFSENESQKDRSANITIKSKDGKTSVQLPIVQEGVVFEVKSNKIGFERFPAYTIITLNTTVKNWEAESSEDWCSLSKSGNQLIIQVEATTIDRTAIISFKGFDTKITVRQSKYAVGDEFSEDGVEGIVGYIGGSVRYVCKKLPECVWSYKNEGVGATSTTDGEYNMAQIKKIPYWEEDYIAFLACDRLNNNKVSGWYLPAVEELKLIRTSHSYFQEDLWSSTELEESVNSAYCVDLRRGGAVSWRFKNEMRTIIAIHKF